MTATLSRRQFDVATTTLAFESEGETCRGRLYRPARPATPPVVVLGPDVAAERTFGYPQYAEQFARAGYAAFVFDYRGFGDSDSDDYHLVDTEMQLADWHAAVDRVRRLDGERRRVALWGYGLGGGHALSVAANRRVDAAIAVAPFVDGRAFARERSARYLARGVGAGIRDRLAGVVGRTRTVPVVGGREEFGLVPRPTGDAYLDCVPPESDWRNELPARSLLDLLRYRPLTEAEGVTCPTLLVAGNKDDIAPPAAVADAADRIDDSTLLRLPIGHTDALGPGLETAAAHQLAFLDGVLGE